MSHVAKPARVCPGCGAEAEDNLLCVDCVTEVREALEQLAPPPPAPAIAVEPSTGKVRWSRAVSSGVLPWEQDASPGLAAQLEDQLARLGQAGTGNGGRGASGPLMYDASARRALDGLRAALASAVLDLGEGDGWPADRGTEATQLAAMAAWLLARIDRVRRHPRARGIRFEITDAVRRGRSVLDPSASLAYAGQCEVCGGALFARGSAGSALCHKCQRVIDDVPARRTALLDEATAGLASRDDILDALPISYGLAVNDQVFRGWVRRGRLAQQGVGPDGEPLWRLGDVLELARAREAKRRR